MSDLHTMTTDDLTDFFAMLPGWEEKFRYIIDLGQKLPPFPEAYRDDEHRIYGCQSMVWMKADVEDDRLTFVADADAAIVRGLIAILMVAYNNKSPEEILHFDIETWLDSLGLRSHLTPTRSNGLESMVKRLQTFARRAHNPD
jgi:cysteine desulfuration protein SufE